MSFYDSGRIELYERRYSVKEIHQMYQEERIQFPHGIVGIRASSVVRIYGYRKGEQFRVLRMLELEEQKK